MIRIVVVAQEQHPVIEKLQQRNTALERENKILREELALLRKHMFGRRTERLEPGQLGLFSDAGLEEAADRAAQGRQVVEQEYSLGRTAQLMAEACRLAARSAAPCR